jgi:hypothetical protein
VSNPAIPPGQSAWFEAMTGKTLTGLYGPPGAPSGKRLIRYLFKRDNGICGICKRLVTTWKGDMRPSVDHIVPRSKGGKHEMSNLQLSHLWCNQSKSNRLQPRQRDDERTVSPMTTAKQRGWRPDWLKPTTWDQRHQAAVLARAKHDAKRTGVPVPMSLLCPHGRDPAWPDAGRKW